MVILIAGQSGPHPPTRSYSRVVRTALMLGAVAVALLPIPVAALGLLPVYRLHARFLMFYSPVVCLLVLAYLFYVRDSLARLMFANILNPLSEPDRYFRAPAGVSLKRALRRLRTALLALLPAVFLGTSFYCAMRYTSRLNESVDLATTAWAPPRQTNGESGLILDSARGKSSVPRSRAPRRPRDSVSASDKAMPKDSIGGSEALAVRQQVLRTTAIDSIPMFTELTVLYIGIFAAALVALILMALKEYAKDAMGLSEEDLVLGGWSTDEGPAGEPPMAVPPQN